MRVSVSDAKGQLTELVRHAEAGEEVLLTRHGQPVAQIVPVRPKYDPAKRRAAFEAFRDSASKKITPGPSAARSQDFLYDEHGLPR